MAKPKLALIPASQGTKLYSVLPADGVGDFTFSRNSAATRINKDGLIETVASGVSRLNYPLIDGVVNGCPSHLLEPERTQKIQYSEAFNETYWTKSGLLTPTSGFVSPKGDLSAFKLTEDSTLNNHRISVNGLIGSGTHTISVLAKANDRNWLLIRNAANNAWFDVSNGVVGNVQSGTGSIENYGNGWYRCSVTMSSLSTPAIGIADNNDSYSYQGDGTSGIYIFGVQVEAGSYPTSYIPNYGTAAGITRSAETANGAGDASTFSDSQGVLMAEISALEGASTLIYRFITLSDGTASNKISIFFNQNGSLTWQLIGGLTVISRALSVAITNNNKIAIRYNSTSAELYVNGILADTALNGMTFSGLSTLQFRNNDGAYNFYGNTKQLQYFDSALNDSDLETITSWTSFTDLANGQTYSIK